MKEKIKMERDLISSDIEELASHLSYSADILFNIENNTGEELIFEYFELNNEFHVNIYKKFDYIEKSNYIENGNPSTKQKEFTIILDAVEGIDITKGDLF